VDVVSWVLVGNEIEIPKEDLHLAVMEKLEVTKEHGKKETKENETIKIDEKSEEAASFGSRNHSVSLEQCTIKVTNPSNKYQHAIFHNYFHLFVSLFVLFWLFIFFQQ